MFVLGICYWKIIQDYSVDSKAELWLYYSSLNCVRFIENKQLMFHHPLDRENAFEILLLVICPSLSQKVENNHWIQIGERMFFTFNPSRTKFGCSHLTERKLAKLMCWEYVLRKMQSMWAADTVCACLGYSWVTTKGYINLADGSCN